MCCVPSNAFLSAVELHTQPLRLRVSAILRRASSLLMRTLNTTTHIKQHTQHTQSLTHSHTIHNTHTHSLSLSCMNTSSFVRSSSHASRTLASSSSRARANVPLVLSLHSPSLSHTHTQTQLVCIYHTLHYPPAPFNLVLSVYTCLYVSVVNEWRMCVSPLSLDLIHSTKNPG